MRKWASIFKIKDKYQQYLDSSIKHKHSDVSGDSGDSGDSVNSSVSERELVVVTHPMETLIPN
jgi:hypothetical protein